MKIKQQLFLFLGLLIIMPYAFGAMFDIVPTGTGKFPATAFVGQTVNAEYKVTSGATTTVPITITYADKQDNFPTGMKIAADSGCKNGTELTPGGSCVLHLEFTPVSAEIGQVEEGGPVVSYKNERWRSYPDNPADRIDVKVAEIIPAKLEWQSKPGWGDMIVSSKAITKTYTVKNIGGEKATLKSINFVPGGDQRLTVAAGGTCKVGDALAPEATCTVNVMANPESAGAVKQDLQLAYGDHDSLLSTTINFTVNTPGKLKWQSEPTWSDMVEGSAAITKTYTVENIGGSRATINSISFLPGKDSRLTIAAGGSCKKDSVLAPHGTCTINVAANPSSAGKVEQNLEVSHDGPGSPLVGTIAFAIHTPAKLVWHTKPSWSDMVEGDASVSKTYTVINAGGLPTTINRVNLNPGDSRLTIAADSSCKTGTTLGPNDFCTIDVIATPDKAGDIAQNLEVADHNILSTAINFTINAPGKLEWNQEPKWHDVAYGADEFNKTYEVINNGGMPVTINNIKFNPGNDARLTIAKDSSCINKNLAPGAICTVDVTVNPNKTGIVDEGLQVEDLNSKIAFYVSPIICWGDNSYQQFIPHDADLTQISLGTSYSCGIKKDSLVSCWGLNNKGQIAPPTDNWFMQISSGANHACGISYDTAYPLACWGDNTYGQSTPPWSPDQIQYLDIAAGGNHSCAIRQGGSVVCWGDNSYGQLNPPDEPFAKISAGANHTCGISIDNELLCWGDNSDGQSTPPTEGIYSEVAAGGNHSCAIKDDGAVVCWGNNDHGQSAPPTGDFTKITAGYGYTCGIKTDGTIACWGLNNVGQTDTPLGYFSEISAGYDHVCAMVREPDL